MRTFGFVRLVHSKEVCRLYSFCDYSHRRVTIIYMLPRSQTLYNVIPETKTVICDSYLCHVAGFISHLHIVWCGRPLLAPEQRFVLYMISVNFKSLRHYLLII